MEAVPHPFLSRVYPARLHPTRADNELDVQVQTLRPTTPPPTKKRGGKLGSSDTSKATLHKPGGDSKHQTATEASETKD